MITITGAKNLKKWEALQLTIIETTKKGEKIDRPAEKHYPLVHEDLKTAFSNLAVHLALLTGYINPKQVKEIETPDPELVESFHPTSYSIAGDDEGVVISGHRILPNGKAVILNTPYTKWEQNEQTGYPFIEDLQEKLERINDEIICYLDGSKRGTDPQGKLPFEDGKGKGTKTKVEVLKDKSEWTPEDYKKEMEASKKSGIPKVGRQPRKG